MSEKETKQEIIDELERIDSEGVLKMILRFIRSAKRKWGTN